MRNLLLILMLMTIPAMGYGQDSQEVILEGEKNATHPDSVMLEGKWIKVSRKKIRADIAGCFIRAT